MSNSNNSILDKVISTQINEEKLHFNPKDIVITLLQTLAERDRNIVRKRHGLEEKKEKMTLEDIGTIYNITRERVRQIEVSSVQAIKNKIKKQDDYDKSLLVLNEIIKEHGGVIEFQSLVDSVKQVIEEKTHDNFIIFFLHLVKDNFIQIKEDKTVKHSWQLPDFNKETLILIIKSVEDILQEKKDIMDLRQLWTEFKNQSYYQEYKEQLNLDIFESYITISQNIENNPFNDWGLKKWSLITPKRMNDKIYLVLKHEGKPLHFKKIATKINEIKFDGKKAHPATVHNELILDHQRYVLVGRGIYALKEWGYKPGVVADVIIDIIKKSDNPLTKELIIKKVLERRIVKESTVALALMDKNKFKKSTDGTYSLLV